MQFQVPQFIEVEDKIFGPLTFKQFVYVIGGLGGSYLLWRALPLLISAPLIAGIGGLAAALAFFQWNGRPFILGVEHGFFYFIRGKLYLWNNERRDAKKKEPEIVQNLPKSQVYIPKLSESKLHELAWSLDIKERIAAGTSPRDQAGRPIESDVMAPVHTAREARVQ